MERHLGNDSGIFLKLVFWAYVPWSVGLTMGSFPTAADGNVTVTVGTRQDDDCAPPFPVLSAAMLRFLGSVFSSFLAGVFDFTRGPDDDNKYRCLLRIERRTSWVAAHTKYSQYTLPLGVVL